MNRRTAQRQPERDRQVSVADLVDSIDQRMSRHLRKLLIAGDAAALAVAITSVLLLAHFRAVRGFGGIVVSAVVFVLAGLWMMRSAELWLARVSAIRVVEITRITRALFQTLLAMVVFDRVVHLGLYIRQLTIATAVAWVLVVAWRSAYRTWLTIARSHDRHCRQMVVVGIDSETRRLIDLFNTHPELGVRLAGVVGSRQSAAEFGCASMWLGDLDAAEHIINAARVRGVVVSTTAVPGRRLNQLIRNLQRDGVHVHVATGIAGIDARRMRSTQLSHEPLLYIEAPTLGKAQRIGKRTFDIFSAGLGIVLASPILVAVALAIKLGDRGPVFFRQVRVGRDGEHFAVLKFRTMVVGADAQVAALQAGNERNGPLFKMQNDPRVTRVGRFLRETSLDELPQLFNVLRGQMSLVGPRPALPSEVANFPLELRNRESVTPGITGLWQVEARDNPSFDAYSRLDLFYVENWSITLDLLIILGTVEQLVVKLFRTVAGAEPQPRPGLTLADAVTLSFDAGASRATDPVADDRPQHDGAAHGVLRDSPRRRPALRDVSPAVVEEIDDEELGARAG